MLAGRQPATDVADSFPPADLREKRRTDVRSIEASRDSVPICWRHHRTHQLAHLLAHLPEALVMVGRAAVAGLAADAELSCLDAGCGEGYYLRQLAAAGSVAAALPARRAVAARHDA